MTSQDTEALKALADDLNKYCDGKVNGGRIINSARRALPSLERMLASQGPVVSGYVPPLNPALRPGESITVTYEPPVAQTQDMVLVPRKLNWKMTDAGYNAAVSAGQMRFSTIDFIWEKILAAAPVASQRGEPCEHPADKLTAVHFGREGWAHWCQVCGAHRYGTGCDWVLPPRTPAAGMDADVVAREIADTFMSNLMAQGIPCTVDQEFYDWIAAIIRKHIP